MESQLEIPKIIEVSKENSIPDKIIIRDNEEGEILNSIVAEQGSKDTHSKLIELAKDQSSMIERTQSIHSDPKPSHEKVITIEDNLPAIIHSDPKPSQENLTTIEQQENLPEIIHRDPKPSQENPITIDNDLNKSKDGKIVSTIYIFILFFRLKLYLLKNPIFQILGNPSKTLL